MTEPLTPQEVNDILFPKLYLGSVQIGHVVDYDLRIEPSGEMVKAAELAAEAFRKFRSELEITLSITKRE